MPKERRKGNEKESLRNQPGRADQSPQQAEGPAEGYRQEKR